MKNQKPFLTKFNDIKSQQICFVLNKGTVMYIWQLIEKKKFCHSSNCKLSYL